MDFLTLYGKGLINKTNMRHADEIRDMLLAEGSGVNLHVDFMPNLFTMDNDLLLYQKIDGKYNKRSYEEFDGQQKFKYQQRVLDFFSLIWQSKH